MSLLERRIYERILQKKRQLDELRPLPSGAVRKIQQQMQVEYIYNSNAIEGNTLTLRETQLVLEEGITVGGKPLRDLLEVRNHPGAIDFVRKIASGGELKEEQILTTHQMVMKDVIEDAGRYREGEVRITGADFIPPPAYDVSFHVREMIQEYARNSNELVPIELAAWLHHRFVWIHPFHDGNGRVARLLMNLVLLRHGYPMTMILRVDRKKYYAVLRQADHGNLGPFANFVASAVERTLDTYLRAVSPKADPLLPLSKASKGTPYSPEYLGLLARTRRVSAMKIGRRWMVSKSAVRAYVAEQQERSSQSGQRRRAIRQR